jgi:uncharacterized NAD(P)/FAD-binding protein YdhS
MASVNICLVGGGPRALITLNALRRHMLLHRSRNLHFVVTIVDPNPPGTGCHDPDQPNYLYTNTLASQLTAFHPGVPDGDEEGWLTGPSFTQWARTTLAAKPGGEAETGTNEESRPLPELDYLPRSMLGQYLSWAYRQIISAFPPTATLLTCNAMAVDLEQRPGGGYRLALSNGRALDVDYLFLSTGHSTNRLSQYEESLLAFADEGKRYNPHLAYLPHCYPVSQLRSISSQATVAIQGLGLTAWDAIAELTEGRGGRYGTRDGRTVYHPSGREPRILLYSRKCLPSAARGINQKGLTGQHVARFFTPAAVDAVRAAKSLRTGQGQLDFEIEVLPMLLTEMAYAHRTTRLGHEVDPEDFKPTPEEIQEINAEFDPFKGRSFSSLDEYRQAFLRLVESDLAQADRGNLTSPIKSATDVIRDCRASICAAVEHRGLTPSSERWFREHLVPDMNRIAFGPPKFRNHQLLALFEAGAVDLAAGPGNRLKMDKDRWRFVIQTGFSGRTTETGADILIAARLDLFFPESDENPMSRALLDRGLARSLRNGGYCPGGFDVTRDFRPVRADGTPAEDMWILGYPTEGAVFYTHAIPRAGLPSKQHAAADACVSRMFCNIDETHSARSSFPV